MPFEDGDRGSGPAVDIARRDLRDLLMRAERATEPRRPDGAAHSEDPMDLGAELAELVPDLHPAVVDARAFEKLGLPPEAAAHAAELYRSLRSEGVTGPVAWDGVWIVAIEGMPRCAGSGLVASGYDGAAAALREAIAVRG